jgi:hypothetical protein
MAGYAAVPYARGNTLGELMRRQEYARAEAIRDEGQRRGNVWADVGHQIAGSLGALAQEKRDAPIRAAKLQELQDVAAARRAKQDEIARAVAVDRYFATTPDPKLEEVVGLAGAVDGPKLFQAWYAASRQPALDAQKADQAAADRRQKENAVGVRRMLGEAVVQSAGQPITDARRQTLQGMALQEGVTLPADVLPQPEKGPNSQESAFLLNGQAVKGDYLPGANGQPGRYFYQGHDVTGQAKQIPPASVMYPRQAGDIAGNFDVTGSAFLESIPKPWRKTVEKIANYDEDPTKVASMRGGMRETLTQWVNQVNPDYDQSNFAIRNPTRKAFTTGPQGQQITALNTAVEHLDLLQAAADALANGSFKPGNQLYNAVRDTFGSAAPSNYDTIKQMVDKEVEAVANKGVPTVSGTAEQKRLASSAASPAVIKGYIDTTIPLMGSKLNALRYQYEQAMGANTPWKPMTPQAQAILEKRGIKLGAGATPATPAAPKDGTEGNVGGVPAVWKTVNGKAGWYAK